VSAAPRVLFFVPALPHGGAERVVLTLVNGLAAEGWTVGLATLAPGGALRGLLDPRVAQPVIGGRAKTPWERARAVLALAHLTADYDILVSGVHLTADTLVHGVRVLHRLTGVRKRYVAMVQTALGTLLALQGRGSRVRRVRAIYPRFDVVCCVSHGVRADVERLTGPLPQARVIYNQMDIPALRAAAAVALDDPLPPFFLNIGRLDGPKAQAVLLRAFARFVTAHGPSHHLVLLGDGPERGALEALGAALGLTPLLHLPGYVDNPWRYLARAAALVSTSTLEGLPLVLAEAMVCRTPVIATDCPHGPRELLEGGEGGYLLPMDDEAGIADAMARVLTAPEEVAAKVARAAHFVEGLASERIVAAYAAMFREVTA
jgi:glycosyltransferase involved in cell wall biosynthesis